MTRTVLETHEHFFELENEMPMFPRKAPKEIYKNELIARGSFFLAGIVLSIIVHSIPNVWEPLTFVPTILMLAALLGVFDSLYKANQEWHRSNRDRTKYSAASREIVEKLVTLNAFYKGRTEDSVMFRSRYFGAEEFFTANVWDRYIQKLHPTKRELKKGFGNAHTGGCLYINDNEGWSFDPEFVNPKLYKVTVKRVKWNDNES